MSITKLVMPWEIQDWQFRSNSGAFSASIRPATRRTTVSPTWFDSIVTIPLRILHRARRRQAGEGLPVTRTPTLLRDLTGYTWENAFSDDTKCQRFLLLKISGQFQRIETAMLDWGEGNVHRKK